jgi:hypothetical protein
LSLALREEHRLRVFENKMLRKVLRPERLGNNGRLEKLHDEELHSL